MAATTRLIVAWSARRVVLAVRVRALWDDVTPILAVLAVCIVIWYGGALLLNAHQVIELDFRGRADWTWHEFVRHALTMARPVLPAPHQVAAEFFDSVFLRPPTSPRSLVYHAIVTSTATVLGFALGAVVGVVLAVLIVHSRTLDRGMLPWIIASQTVPCSPLHPLSSSCSATSASGADSEGHHLDVPVLFSGNHRDGPGPAFAGHVREGAPAYLRRLTRADVLKLRLPAALPMLLPSLRVAIAAGLVGTIVAELPTGAQAGSAQDC